MKYVSYFILLTILSIFATGCGDDDDNHDYKPVAAFKIIGYESDVPNIELGDQVVLKDLSYDMNGEIVSWNYEFGDNESSTEQNPTHIYKTMGEYTISLTTTDNSGQVSFFSYTRNIKIVEPSFADEEPSILWTVELPGSTNYNKSGVTISDDGTVFVGLDGPGGDNVYAIDNVGQKKWSYKTPSGKIYGSMALSNDNTLIYGADADGYIFSLNTIDGSRNWENQITTSISYGGTVLSTDESTIYIGCYSGNNDFKAVNTSDGSVRWELSTTNGVRTTAAIGSNGNIYISDLYRRIYALLPDGTVKWSITDKKDDTANPIAIDENRNVMYLGTKGKHFYCISLENGTINWENTETDGVYLNGAAIGADGIVYITSESDHTIRALDPDNGNTIWERALNGKLKAVPSIDEKGNLYLGDLNGYFYVLNREGKDLWKPIQLSGEISAACSISDEGIIYVLAFDETLNGNRLYALETDKTPIAKEGWPTRAANNKRQGRK